MSSNYELDEKEAARKLPVEIIFYILSYLPLSSLFSFRCVCKLWYTLFLHPDLAKLHFENRRWCWGLDDVDVYKEMENCGGSIYSRITASSDCLFLDQEVKTRASSYPLRYRVYSPLLHQSVAIPNPGYPSLCSALEFVPSNEAGAVKLVSVHEDDESQYSLGYEILTLGIGNDRSSYRWRTVKVPTPNLKSERDARKRERFQVFFRMGVAYCIWYVKTDDDIAIEVDVLDMVSETYIGHTTCPRGGFFSKLSSTSLLDWNGRLSFAELVKDELHVLVLDDYKKLKWAETKRIIKLTFLKPDHKELITFSPFC